MCGFAVDRRSADVLRQPISPRNFFAFDELLSLPHACPVPSGNNIVCAACRAPRNNKGFVRRGLSASAMRPPHRVAAWPTVAKGHRPVIELGRNRAGPPSTSRYRIVRRLKPAVSAAVSRPDSSLSPIAAAPRARPAGAGAGSGGSGAGAAGATWQVACRVSAVAVLVRKRPRG